MSINRILINGLTLEQATLAPLLYNCRYYLSRGISITFFGNKELKKNIDRARIINNYEFIEFTNSRKITTHFQFIYEALRRNFSALAYLNKFKGQFDIVYSRSSVLDLIIFPFLLKSIDKKIRWVTVFDNKVALCDPGNKLIRFLAWIFFRLSLLFLHRADKIFVISLDLKLFLLKNGFKERDIVITGNAVEADIIRQSNIEQRYEIDALFVGRINEAKGIYDMLKILEIVKKEYPEFQLAIMGDGDEATKRNLFKKIQKMKLGNNIQFLGYKIGIEKFNIIKSSKSFWFFSLSESFGIALLEAVCCGLSAFAYDLPPFRKIYKNNEVNLIEKNNYQEAASRIIKLFRSGVFENKSGELLLDKYSWEKIVQIEYNSFTTF